MPLSFIGGSSSYFADVRLFLAAHKIVLASGSPVLAAALNSQGTLPLPIN
jgi:hypothetical protein